VVDDLQPPVRRYDVNLVRSQLLAAQYLHDRHAGAQREDVRQLAAMLGIEVHDDDERGTAVRRSVLEEGLQRLDSTRRSADHDYRRVRATDAPLVISAAGLCLGHPPPPVRKFSEYLMPSRQGAPAGCQSHSDDLSARLSPALQRWG
jgi:hypothetical protein